MSERLKELLEKINEEGIRRAEETANSIISKANKEAERILNDAKAQAQALIQEAKDTIRKMEASSNSALSQSARNLVIFLKEEIRKLLDRIVAVECRKVLDTNQIGPIIKDLIQSYVDKKGEASDIRVLLKKEDLDALRDTFIASLKDRLKEGIEFKPSKDINAGFYISFDKGKSYFDFTDDGVKQALCAYLNQELTRLLK